MLREPSDYNTMLAKVGCPPSVMDHDAVNRNAHLAPVMRHSLAFNRFDDAVLRPKQRKLR